MNLQPLNICMSYQGTLNLIEKISEDHDVEVQYWCDQMKDLYLQKVKKLHSFTGFLLYFMNTIGDWCTSFSFISHHNAVIS